MSEDRRVRKTKKLIKDTLIELLNQKSINKISVTELTEKADISRKTFYLHYSSIYDAKNELDNDIIDILNSIMQTVPDTMKETDIMDFFTQLNLKAQDHKELVAYFIQNSNQSELYAKVKSAIKNAVMQRLENSNKGNINNEYIVEFVVSGILNSYIEKNTKDDISTEKFSVLLTKLCSGALAFLISN